MKPHKNKIPFPYRGNGIINICLRDYIPNTGQKKHKQRLAVDLVEYQGERD